MLKFSGGDNWRTTASCGYHANFNYANALLQKNVNDDFNSLISYYFCEINLIHTVKDSDHTHCNTNSCITRNFQFSKTVHCKF